MLIRMTNPIQTRFALPAAIALALFAGSAIASPEDNTSQRAIVVAGAAADDKAALTQAPTVAEATGADLKVVKRNAEQLGVVHMLAVRGYDTVVTVGVDRPSAIAPVAEKFPRVRFVAAKANGLGAAMSGA
jgi:basic membrane lipoprotein Med (substrate-binding protein (PBP1-ABC) superfamily)